LVAVEADCVPGSYHWRAGLKLELEEAAYMLCCGSYLGSAAASRRKLDW
jgi:hypothetical protein